MRKEKPNEVVSDKDFPLQIPSKRSGIRTELGCLNNELSVGAC